MVDMGRGFPHILGIILDHNDFYTIAVKSGMHKSKYPHNEFDICPQTSDYLISTKRTVLLQQWPQLFQFGTVPKPNSILPASADNRT